MRGRVAARDPGGSSARFAAILSATRGARGQPRLVGVEHEYRVSTVADGAPVDFRTVIHGLALGRRHLDPDDPYAYRLPSGHAVTCDAAEAEIALAPAVLGPGTAREVARSAAAERADLASSIGSALRLEDHSTHVSVSVPDDGLADAIGRAFAPAFGADVVRLVASAERCGIWVRPRAGRLEICLDAVAGPRLAAVVVFAAAAIEATIDAVSGVAGVALPPAVRVFAGRPRQRSGWNLPRRSFDGDPFDDVGAAPLRLADGGSMTAGEHIAAAWGSIRPRAMAIATPEELALADAVVDEPCAEPGWGAAAARGAGQAAEAPAAARAPAAAFGEALVARSRPAYGVALVALTWGFAVFLVLRARRWWRPERRAFAVMPREMLATFLSCLDEGGLDEVLGTYLAAPPTGRVLARSDQTATPGLFDALGLRRALLPEEPTVGVVRLTPLAVSA